MMDEFSSRSSAFRLIDLFVKRLKILVCDTRSTSRPHDVCILFNDGVKVFTSTSTMAFKTFPCDHDAVEGESYLRADYSLSCNTTKHSYFKIYAGFMIVVGIGQWCDMAFFERLC